MQARNLFLDTIRNNALWQIVEFYLQKNFPLRKKAAR